MKEEPFYKVILGKMEEEKRTASKDLNALEKAEDHLTLLGSVLKEALLPESRRSEIVETLRKMIKEIPGPNSIDRLLGQLIEAIDREKDTGDGRDLCYEV